MSWRMLVRWLPVLAWMGLIYALSSLSAPAPSDLLGRKVWLVTLAGAAHMGEYGILAALVLFAAGRVSWRTGVLVVAFAAAYGITDELHQATVPQRVSTPADLALDTLGAAAVVVLAFPGLALWRRFRAHKSGAVRSKAAASL